MLLDGSDDRPGDVFLRAWRGGPLALDVTVPHVLTQRTPASAEGLHAMEAAVARKEAKYSVRCRDAGVGFSVLAFDTLGAVLPATEAFLKAMFKEAALRDVCPDVRYVQKAWHRVVVPLQVDVARQVLARSFEPSLDCLSKEVYVSPPVPAPRVVPVSLGLPRARSPLAACGPTAHPRRRFLLYPWLRFHRYLVSFHPHPSGLTL